MCKLSDFTEFKRQLETAFSSGGPKAFPGIAFLVSNVVLEEGIMPDIYFEHLLAVIGDSKFLRLRGSWRLIQIFEENWNELSDEQRSRLLPVLESTYDLFHDWKACFIVSEFIGKMYTDEGGYATLCRLKGGKEEMPRSFVPHEFEHLAREASNVDLRTRALSALKMMQEDKSEMVRKEVGESLRRLQDRGRRERVAQR